VKYLPELKQEYAYWMQGATRLRPGSARRRVVAMSDGSILNRYWDELDTPRDESYAEDTALARSSARAAPALYRDLRAAAESGWDFSSRWLADAHSLTSIQTTAIVPVDLNSLLYGLERSIAAVCAAQRQARCAGDFEHRANARRAAMNRFLWDPRRGVYLDYLWSQRVPSPRVSAAMFYPLFTGAASPHQARRVASAAQALLAPGGLASTNVATGQQCPGFAVTRNRRWHARSPAAGWQPSMPFMRTAAA
jgi:alpha,alpha-trehalase